MKAVHGEAMATTSAHDYYSEDLAGFYLTKPDVANSTHHPAWRAANDPRLMSGIVDPDPLVSKQMCLLYLPELGVR